MAEEETPAEKPILRNAEIIRVSTDAEGFINIKVELPEEMLLRINADVVGLAYLTGTITRFLGSLLENAAKEVLEQGEKANSRQKLVLPGREN